MNEDIWSINGQTEDAVHQWTLQLIYCSTFPLSNWDLQPEDKGEAVLSLCNDNNNTDSLFQYGDIKICHLFTQSLRLLLLKDCKAKLNLAT